MPTEHPGDDVELFAHVTGVGSGDDGQYLRERRYLKRFIVEGVVLPYLRESLDPARSVLRLARVKSSVNNSVVGTPSSSLVVRRPANSPCPHPRRQEPPCSAVLDAPDTGS